MKLRLTSSARGVVVTALAIALVVPASVVSQDRTAVTPAAAYYLLGDSTNSGSAATNFNSASSGDAWHFYSSGSSATALVGQCPNGSACWGVQGLGTGIGVYGSASTATATSTIGVQGSGGSTAASGTSYGGYFTSTNGASGGKAYGVYASGTNYGAYATSSGGNGVYATSLAASGNGVYANGSGSSFYGVWGDVGGGGFGVVGSSSGGTGSYGSSTGSTGGSATVAGVYGYNSLAVVDSRSTHNSGVFGSCPNCNGVYGTSANYAGVRGTATGSGTGTYGGYFSAAKGTGVYARTNTGKVAFRAVNPNKTSTYYAGVFDGNVRINGNYAATGTKSAIVTTSQGDRLMYAEEATQNYFSDQGTATLKAGRAIVKIDALFAQTVDLSTPYMVIVTPQSFDTTGLGVGNLTARSFEVRELNGGKGTFTFSWRITALRKGYVDARMAAAPANVGLSDADGRGALPSVATSNDTPMTDESAAPPTSKQPPVVGKHIGPAAK